METRYYFVDTNLFLQCYPIHELSWDRISLGMQSTLLVVPRAVIDELDNHKRSVNSRIAKKARQASALFKEIMEAGVEKTFPLRGGFITVQFGPRYHPDDYMNLPDRIELEKSDDRIVADAWLFSRDQNVSVSVLTHDTGLSLTARHFGLQTTDIPGEWFLPQERDASQKEIRRLQQRVSVLENQLPVIEVQSEVEEQVSDRNGHLSVALATWGNFEPDSEVESLMKLAQELAPMKTDFESEKKELRRSPVQNAFPFRQRYRAPSEEAITRYQEVEYKDWLNDFERALHNILGRLEWHSRIVTLSFSVSNTGTIPAENLLITLRSLNGATLVPPDEEIKDPVATDLPEPPEPPAGKWIVDDPFHSNALAALSNLGGYTGFEYQPTLLGPSALTPRRDKYALYWQHGPPHDEQSEWIFECDEFRHQEEPRTITVQANVPDELATAAFEIVASAKNMPEPTRHKLILGISHEPINVHDRLTGLVRSRLNTI